MDIEKAKKELLSNVTLAGGYEPPLSKAIQTVLNELDNKDKIINKAVDIIENYQICDYEITDYRYRKCEYIADDETPPCKECIREYLESE